MLKKIWRGIEYTIFGFLVCIAAVITIYRLRQENRSESHRD